MKIRDLFRTEPQTFSFEFFPPKTSQEVDELLERIGVLKALGPSFMSVTYGAGGSTRRNTFDLVCRCQEALGIAAMAHLTCVGHSQTELREILRELQCRGVDNLMCLRGDPPRGQDNFTPAPDGFAHAHELVTLARTLGDFSIGVAGYPETHPECADPQRDLEHLHAKVACGADFITTQLFFDNRDYFAFCARARQRGIQARIIPGIMPITNYRQIVRFTTMCGASLPEALRQRLEPVADDPHAVLEIGVDWAWRQCEELLAQGAPGIHFYTLNRSLATQRIFAQLQTSSVANLLPTGGVSAPPAPEGHSPGTVL
ncbi:MAG: methylenetetrahydrofolate reductase [NAD(P)H] [Candidatus Tectomicrobia bacterium]|uniref:Methylenetetrahydrofolate reductase n=1 Tax=Tectimicrobiota bacterium TaxID=2528274 RepID=A0A938B143_UNCTE|nr:methylenetetrahydrofolate reductase [NAD(P)H] [Candidatus Tectomicrobia bacterium]